MDRLLNCLIMGAAGRDFHDFLTFFRDQPTFRVRAFTATQIPFIAARSFPRELAGSGYTEDIPIYSESRLPELIRELEIDFVFLAYSDLSHADVMHKASLVQACGASFAVLGPRHTQLIPRKPTIAVTAVRTGAGKSPISQMLARHLTDVGHRVGIIRHPMPYGELKSQTVERFGCAADLDRYECTIEEREEYEPYIEMGLVIYAGVDYRRILEEAEGESDVILWDGGNNDTSFVRPGLLIVVVDALRPGHETEYYPGETNLRSADVVVINKVGQASKDGLECVRRNIAAANPEAVIVEGDLSIEMDTPELIVGKRALVVEDGPTLTHGGMAFGAGMIAAREHGAGEVVEPRESAVGSVAETLRKFPHLHGVLPALGYSADQRAELAETIEKSGADVVIDASPARLDRVLDVSLPVLRVRYRFQQVGGTPLTELAERFLRTA